MLRHAPIPSGSSARTKPYMRERAAAILQISAGMAEVHTPHECVSLAETVSAAQIVLACATS